MSPFPVIAAPGRRPVLKIVCGSLSAGAGHGADGFPARENGIVLDEWVFSCTHSPPEKRKTGEGRFKVPHLFPHLKGIFQPSIKNFFKLFSADATELATA